MVLFQVLTDSQVFHSPYMDTANRIHFSLPQLSRTPSFDTIDSHKQVNISSWQHIIYYSQQRFLLSAYSSWLQDILLGHSYLKPFSDVLNRLCESFQQPISNEIYFFFFCISFTVN